MSLNKNIFEKNMQSFVKNVELLKNLVKITNLDMLFQRVIYPCLKICPFSQPNFKLTVGRASDSLYVE